MKVVAFNKLSVSYLDDLDGGGIWLAKDFLRFVKALKSAFSIPGKFRRVFEWCSGPGFIGFALLGEGLCDALCLADINPLAIDCVRDTISNNKLEGQVTAYVSDNFKSIPREEQFDLVVANPPNYFSINPRHPSYNQVKDDLRPNDPGWRVHRDFYASVRNHLLDGALLVISEVDPRKSKVFLRSNEPVYDIRPRPALTDFKAMIMAGGLDYVGAFPYKKEERFELAMVVSRKAQSAQAPATEEQCVELMRQIGSREMTAQESLL
ncbi:MAG: methyltransferase [Actinomycetota bacterium]|nr:methyltransferase [Actinomycetota bacterium]